MNIEAYMADNGIRQIRLREGQMGFSVQLMDSGHTGLGDTVEAALSHAQGLQRQWRRQWAR